MKLHHPSSIMRYKTKAWQLKNRGEDNLKPIQSIWSNNEIWFSFRSKFFGVFKSSILRILISRKFYPLMKKGWWSVSKAIIKKRVYSNLVWVWSQIWYKYIDSQIRYHTKFDFILIPNYHMSILKSKLSMRHVHHVGHID